MSAGLGEVSIVLLPGLDGTGLSFLPLLRELPQTLKPIVVRYPGDRHMTYAELLPLVMDALPREGRFIILGESFSGPLAMMAAEKRPAGLLGIVLCATFVGSPRRVLGAVGRPLVRSLPFRLYGPYKRLRSVITARSTARRHSTLDEMLRLVTPQVLAMRVRMVLQCDASKALRCCAVPVLYLQGTRDWVVPAGNLKRIRAMRPDVSAVRISSPHMVLQHKPAVAATAIASFVRSLTE